MGKAANSASPQPRLDRLLSSALAAARFVAGIAVVICSVLATMDTLGLWLFRRPVVSVVEISQVLLLVIMFFGLGTAERVGDHISVSLVRDLLPSAVRRAMDILARIFSVLVYLVLGAAGWVAANRSLRLNEFSDGLIAFPLYPFRYILVIGAALAIFAALAVVIYGTTAVKAPDLDGD